MRRIAIVMIFAASLAAFGINVQFGVSGRSEEIAYWIPRYDRTDPSNDWFGITRPICATDRYVKVYGDYTGNVVVPQVELFARLRGYYLDDGQWVEDYQPYGEVIRWRNPNNPYEVTLGHNASAGGFYDAVVTINGEAMPFGSTVSSYNHAGVDHGVLTVRGDPTSLVINDTSVSRTINGVVIPSGEGKRLPFPFYLKTTEIPNVSFWDAWDNTPITQGRAYSNGSYLLGYTGDIRIKDGSSPTNTPLERLVYSSQTDTLGKLLYANNGDLIYSEYKILSTNLTFNTWWDFDVNDWGGSPKAMINGEVVCSSHSTGHLIGYYVSMEDMRISLNRYARGSFTMTQIPTEGYTGGACVYKCWDGSMPNTQQGYADTPAGHKAEYSGGTVGARFEVVLDLLNRTWTVTAHPL